VRKSDDKKKRRTRGKKQPQAIVTLPAEGDGFVSQSTTCAVFQFSRPTLYRLMARGIFPRPYKNGGMSVWDLSELRAHRDKIRGGGK